MGTLPLQAGSLIELALLLEPSDCLQNRLGY